MPEINQETMENTITPVILAILHDAGIPCEVVETTAISIDDSWLVMLNSWGVVLSLMYEAICTGYLLGLDKAMPEGTENAHDVPSEDSTVP